MVSDWIDICSEYRVFVYMDEFLAKNHAGSPLVFPQAEKLERMVEQYKCNKERP